MYLKLKNVGVLSAEKHRHTLSDVLMENIILQFVLSLGGADFLYQLLYITLIIIIKCIAVIIVLYFLYVLFAKISTCKVIKHTI